MGEREHGSCLTVQFQELGRSAQLQERRIGFLGVPCPLFLHIPVSLFCQNHTKSVGQWQSLSAQRIQTHKPKCDSRPRKGLNCASPTMCFDICFDTTQTSNYLVFSQMIPEPSTVLTNQLTLHDACWLMWQTFGRQHPRIFFSVSSLTIPNFSFGCPFQLMATLTISDWNLEWLE